MGCLQADTGSNSIRYQEGLLQALSEVVSTVFLLFQGCKAWCKTRCGCQWSRFNLVPKRGYRVCDVLYWEVALGFTGVVAIQTRILIQMHSQFFWRSQMLMRYGCCHLLPLYLWWNNQSCLLHSAQLCAYRKPLFCKHLWVGTFFLLGSLKDGSWS
jgi:hypothetical protein